VGNPLSTIIAASKGLPIQMIASGMKETTETPAYSALLVADNGPIKTAADLKGKTIAVNTLQNIGTLTIGAVLDKEGVDPSSVKFVEVPFPEMGAALEKSRVDAIWVVEPFTTLNTDQGARVLFEPLAGTAPSLQVGTWFAAKPYIAENADVVDRFAAAIQKSNSYASENPDEVRRIVTTFTEIPEEVAQKMALGDWSPEFNRPSIELLGQLAEKDGIIEEQPAYDELIRG
jgi:NitT/TauT family transport system substrate-binding protein